MLRVFSEYCSNTPCTGVDKMFDTLVDGGAKILPSDKLALEILNHVFGGSESPGAQIHKLLNIRFADLPASIRPRIKPGRKALVANWTVGDVISDKVMNLIDWSGGKKGFWSDVHGNKQSVIDVTFGS
jgi:hypothetical protein